MVDLKGLSREQKVKTLTETITEIAEKADEAAGSDELVNWLKVMSRFHQYSPSNGFLIALQRPDATRVAGFRQWENKFNRKVKKGSKGIAILVPFVRKNQRQDHDLDDDENELTPRRRLYFGVGYVFDVTDTEGDPLPELHYRPQGDQDNGMSSDLVAFAGSEHITVTREAIGGSTKGWSLPGLVCVDPTYPLASQACTLAHELAHEYLHQRHGETLSRSCREVEAEAAAAVVAYSYGLEPASENYIANWTDSRASGDRVLDRMERIRAAAAWILDGIEDNRRRALVALSALGVHGAY
jgi:hypothetical protein